MPVAAARSGLLRSAASMALIHARIFKNHKKPHRDGRTITVGRVEDVPSGRAATIELDDGTELALYNVGGSFYALENFCPHRGAPLVDGQSLQCGGGQM
ncbi:MAG: Rieske (2Fe-2S) protein [Pyrinomonadaceae bacterium]